jgi:hypothetical protein
MSRLSISALVLLAVLNPALRMRRQPGGMPAAGDEFVGPFASWTNIRTVYGAVGDGTADDTGPLQRALTDVGMGGHAPVLFLPAGTYRLTAPLRLTNRQHVALVGADPATTRLAWDGGPDAMLIVDGVAYSRIVRLTFDGRGRAAIGVDQSWNGLTGPFDTGNEYAEDQFMDARVGLRGGFRGAGFAETTVSRSRFVRNEVAGISLGNFNALDLWVSDSLFDRCGAGVTNGAGAGNFHVYDSVFRHSSVADLFVDDTGGFSARGNVSTASRAFFVSGASTNNPATIHLQGNTIVDPFDPAPIRVRNQGPGLLTDNVIRSRAGAAGPAVQWASLLGATVISVGNTFTVSNAVAGNGRLLRVDDRQVPRASIRPAEPARGEPWPDLHRRVFDVAPEADGAAIQQAIASAVASGAIRPIVHVPAGTHLVRRSIVVPASDVQIAGDGAASVLLAAPGGTGPVLRLDGPSRATLRDLRIDAAGLADGLVIGHADQAGARIFLHGVQLRGGTVTALHIRRLDHASVQIEDFGQAYTPHATAVVVRGGPAREAGRPSEGRVNIFSGASSGNRVSFDVSSGARLLVRDLWYESGAGPGFASVHGRATFTADGLRVSSPTGQGPAAFDIADLDGAAAIVATHLDDRIRVAGSGAASRVLALGLFCEQPVSACYENVSSPAARATVALSREISRMFGTRSAAAGDAGVPLTAAVVRDLLGHTRAEHRAPLVALPPGVSDVRLFRIWIERGVNDLVIDRE